LFVLFVHGMGRSPISACPLLCRLRHDGVKTGTFGYAATFEDFSSIVERLRKRIALLAKVGNYVVVGHSLGGVLLRAALNSLPQDTVLPKQVYLLGSPILPSRLATRLKGNSIFRAIAGDCGQLLGSPKRMESIGSLAVPTTAIVGIRGITSRYSLFGNDLNDGVVSVSEVNASWLSMQIQVPVIHTLLPSSRLVAKIIAQSIVQNGG
jgi:pimeloyl-ACP methyl ester carboxylesterase